MTTQESLEKWLARPAGALRDRRVAEYRALLIKESASDGRTLEQVQAAATARLDASAASLAERQAVWRAYRMRQSAMEWPRCGEKWPSGKKEEAADLLLRTERAQEIIAEGSAVW